MSKVWFVTGGIGSLSISISIRPRHLLHLYRKGTFMMREPSPAKCANTLCAAAQHIMTLPTVLLGLVLAAGFQGSASAAEPLTPHRPTESHP